MRKRKMGFHVINCVTVLIFMSVLHILSIPPYESPTKARVVNITAYNITVAPRVTIHSPVPMSERLKAVRRKRVSLGSFKLTAYCPCEECSGGYGRETSTGVVAREGRTVAVDPDVIPYGTAIRIKGLGVFVAEDCGGKVKGNHIDIYFESHKETEKFGVRYGEVYRMKGGD